jgi:hypothetical protein
MYEKFIHTLLVRLHRHTDREIEKFQGRTQKIIYLFISEVKRFTLYMELGKSV